MATAKAGAKSRTAHCGHVSSESSFFTKALTNDMACASVGDRTCRKLPSAIRSKSLKPISRLMDSMPPTAWTCFELEAWPLGNQRSNDLVEAGELQKEASMEWGRLGWLLQLRKTAIPPTRVIRSLSPVKQSCVYLVASQQIN